MSDKTKTPMSELMDEAMKNYEQALQAGLRLQQESAKWWTGVVTQSAAPADWSERCRKAADQTIPLVQRCMEDSLRMVEQNNRTSLDLFKQALNVATGDSVAKTQTRLQELWEASLQALRKNSQAVAQSNSKVVESWMQLFAAGAEPDTNKPM